MAGKRRSCTSTITSVVPSRASVIGCVAGMKVSLEDGSEASVEAAVLDGLGHVLRSYPLTSAQVGDSAGNFEDAIVTSGGEAETAHRLLEEMGSLERRSAEAPHLAPAHPGIDARPGAGQALRLTAACQLDPGADHRRRLAASRRELGVGDGPHFEMQIDPVEEGPRETRQIPLPLARRADARIEGGAAASAVVGGAHQLKARGEGRASGGAGDDYAAVLERLAQGFEHALRELGQLVEEEHPQVREACLARMRHAAPADQSRARGGMVRSAEGPLAHEPMARREQAGHAPHRGDLDRLLESEGGQDGPKTARQHGLARSWRAQHEQVVAAGRRDLEGALGPEMAPHICEIETVGIQVRIPGGGPVPVGGDLALAVQVLEGIVERTERDHGDSPDHRGLLGIARGHEETLHSAAPAVERDGEHATNGLYPSVEGELAQGDRIVGPSRLEYAGGGENAQRHGQVEGRADLADFGGREVDGDPIHGKLEPRVADRRAHAIAALAHGGVGETHGGKGRQARRHIDLDEDVVGLDAEHGDQTHARQHGSSVRTFDHSVNDSIRIHRDPESESLGAGSHGTIFYRGSAYSPLSTDGQKGETSGSPSSRATWSASIRSSSARSPATSRLMRGFCYSRLTVVTIARD